MRISELLNESISAHTTISAITNDIGNSVNRTYESLANLAETLANNQGSLRGYPLVAGGVGSRWFQTIYVNRLQSELYDLVKYAPKHTKELADFLKSYPDSFGTVASRLPDILVKVASRINNRGLEQMAQKWIDRRSQHLAFIAKIRASLKDDSTDTLPTTTSSAKASEPPIHGKQATAAEHAIAHVLKDLPKDVASEIRAAIAKSDNKLQALQKELAKRNITL